jgi:putative FmdB family regulatory protein
MPFASRMFYNNLRSIAPTTCSIYRTLLPAGKRNFAERQFRRYNDGSEEFMPIFEYVCDVCDKEFELLVSRDEQVNCPSCNSDRLSKLYSRFGLGASSSDQKYESLPMYKAGCGCTPATCGCKNS